MGISGIYNDSLDVSIGTQNVGLVQRFLIQHTFGTFEMLKYIFVVVSIYVFCVIESCKVPVLLLFLSSCMCSYITCTCGLISYARVISCHEPCAMSWNTCALMSRSTCALMSCAHVLCSHMNMCSHAMCTCALMSHAQCITVSSCNLRILQIGDQ